MSSQRAICGPSARIMHHKMQHRKAVELPIRKHCTDAVNCNHQRHLTRKACTRVDLAQQADGVSAPAPTTSLDTVEMPYAVKKWMWRNNTISYITAGCGDPIVLIHGFGLSASHYRKTIKALSKTYKVYAIDLLGFGNSSKPVMPNGYTMELWQSQVLDFMAEFTSGTRVTLVGNSLGGLVSLMVAADAPEDAVRGVVLLNTAGAMNNKGLLGDWRIMLLYPLLLLIDLLLSIPQVALSIFNNVRTKDNIRKALLQVYCNAESVTEELVELVHLPSLDTNACEVFVSVFTGPPGPKPFDLVPRISVPILTLWGDQDKLTPADGPVGKFFQELPKTRPNTVFKFLPGVGHCLHDDHPELVHQELLPWLETLHSNSTTRCIESRGEPFTNKKITNASINN